jgi:hypothetical protein
VGRKIHDDAFAFYVAMGEERTYQLVAEHYGCSKRAVVYVARREDWSGRLAKIEEAARKRVDKKLAIEQGEVDLRHRKMLRAMAARAAQAIQEHSLATGMEGIRAAEITIKLERLIAGEPNERSAVKVEQVTRQEIDRLIAPVEVLPQPASDEGEDDGDAGDEW